MKKRFLGTCFALVLCLCCAFMVTGCDIKEKEQALKVEGCPTSVAVYNPESENTGNYDEWIETQFSSIKVTFTAPEGSGLENLNVSGLKDFRKAGGRISFDGRSTGTKTATFSYQGYKVEIEGITVA